MKYWLVVTFLFVGGWAKAQSTDDTFSSQISNFGVAVSGGLGINDFTITSPNTEAIYSGFAIDTNLYAPIWQNDIFALNTGLSFRYLDASNNANSGAGKEYVEMYGPGLGLNLNIYRLLIGANYYFMNGKHYWVGDNSEELKYDMQVLSTYVGLYVPISSSMKVMFAYSQSSGELPKSKTNFINDAPFESNTVWFYLVYGAGDSVGQFIERLFK